MADTEDILNSVGKELRDDPPSVLEKTAKKFGKQRANKQRVAILLSKSRRLGAKVPPRKQA